MFLFLNMPIILSAERLEKVVCGVLCLIYVKNWRRKGSENGKERRKKEGYRERKEGKSELAEVGRKEGGRTGGRKLDTEEGKKEGGREDGEEGGQAGRQEGIVTCSQGTGKLMAGHGVWQYSYGDEILGRHSMIPLQIPVLF